MRAFMRSALFATTLAALALTACGKDIGDSCVLATDCDPNGTRTCDLSQKEGYCTILGCDFDTCPDNSACIRFFSGDFDNLTCNQATEDQPGGTNDCDLDELCDLEGHCVPRSSEVRYCMATCSNNGDCRDGYECRDLELMKKDGGEPVLAPGVPVDEHAPKFCAAKPPST